MSRCPTEDDAAVRAQWPQRGRHPSTSSLFWMLGVVLRFGGLERLALPLVSLGRTANGLFAGCVVICDIEELVRRLGILTRDLVNEILALEALGESGDDVALKDLRQEVLLLGDALDVFPEGLTIIVRTAMEVSRILKPTVGALEIVLEEVLKVPPILYATLRQLVS